jgi:hypothetical protein
MGFFLQDLGINISTNFSLLLFRSMFYTRQNAVRLHVADGATGEYR